MNICVFEDDKIQHLHPITLTRPAFDLRTGRHTQLEEIARVFGEVPMYAHCRKYLEEWTAMEHSVLVNRIPAGLPVLFVNARLSTSSGLIDTLRTLDPGGAVSKAYVSGDDLAAMWIPSFPDNCTFSDTLDESSFEIDERIEVINARFVNRVWDMLDNLPENIHRWFKADTGGYNVFERPNTDIHPGATLINGEAIFVGEGSRIHAGAILNASNGPIYIDNDVTIFENAVITGPAVIGRGSQVRINANIKNVATGAVCKIGGEIHDSIIHSYSSKVHDGFLGHSYLGRWCNLGAGTSNSNLRNDYGPVSAYNFPKGVFEETGRQFLGLIMGDHSKCSIGTTFNTGTTIGVCCNLFGPGFHPRFVPSFTWGTPPDRYVDYRLDKATEVARVVMARRSLEMTDVDRDIMKEVHSRTAAERSRGVRK